MEAYIIKGFRSAVGKAKKGGFKNYRSDDLAVEVVKHLMAQTPELDPKAIDDVIVGCANPEGEQGFQIGRMVSVRGFGQRSTRNDCESLLCLRPGNDFYCSG